jgi:L-rhamnose mutarotase
MTQIIIFKEAEMALQRILMRRALKPECVADYVRYHQNVPAGLLEGYRKAGVLQLSCFLHENDLIVLLEVDREKWTAAQDDLSNSKVEQDWQALMRTLNLPGFEPLTYEEVFHLPRI